MKRIPSTIAILLFIIGSCSLSYYLWRQNAPYITTNSFSVLTEPSTHLDRNSLVIFDVDKVLLTETDPYERGHRAERKQANTISSLFHKKSAVSQQISPQERDRLWSLYVQGLQESLIDPSIPETIALLQNQGVKVIALTRFMTGRAGGVDHIETVRINTLRAVGIDFGRSFPAHPSIAFPQFVHEGRSPAFKDGVLFTSFASTKGELLLAFFDAIQWHPDTVIMFDDKKANLESVYNALQTRGIPFTGYIYTKAQELPAFFDKKYTELQLDTLMKYGTWFDVQECKTKCIPH